MSDKIKCPKCGAQIDINEIVEQNLKQEFNAKFLGLKTEFDKKSAKLDEKLATFDENFKNAVAAEIAKQTQILNAKNAQDAKILEQSLKAKIEAENLAKNEILKRELNEKSQKINELNKIAAENEVLKRQNSEIETKIQLESEKKINEILNVEREKISKQISEKNELKMREKDEQIGSMQKQILELSRKAEIGSQQAQGEVQEIAIEDILKEKFRYDEIIPVPKGVNGADCEQIIIADDFSKCGKILYESKRTQSFGGDWIEKFKKDMTEAKADAGILVTKTLPKGVSNINFIEGVWVCSFSDFKWLCEVVRQNLIEINYVKKAGQNVDTKMGLVYNYLISNEFRAQMENIVHAFIDLQDSLTKEQNAMKKIWKSRELSIEKARDNAIAMHAKLRNIAGAEISDIDEISLENVVAIENKE